jgi:hypothetical protein
MVWLSPPGAWWSLMPTYTTYQGGKSMLYKGGEIVLEIIVLNLSVFSTAFHTTFLKTVWKVLFRPDILRDIFPVGQKMG